MEKRLLDILKYYNLSSSAFADKLGVQRSSISHLLSGRNKPGFDFLSRLLDNFPDINIDWFINGKGSMIKTDNKINTDQSLFKNNLIDAEINPEVKYNYNSEPKDVKDKITNVNSNIITSVKSVKRIIIFYNDKTWEELTSDH